MQEEKMPVELRPGWVAFWTSLPVLVRLFANKAFLKTAFISGATTGLKVAETLNNRTRIRTSCPDVRPSTKEFDISGH